MDPARVASRLSPAPPTPPLLGCPPPTPHISSLSAGRHGYPRRRCMRSAASHRHRMPSAAHLAIPRSCSLRLWLVRLSLLPSCVTLASSLAGGGAHTYLDVLLSHHSILFDHTNGSFIHLGVLTSSPTQSFKCTQIRPNAREILDVAINDF